MTNDDDNEPVRIFDSPTIKRALIEAFGDEETDR